MSDRCIMCGADLAAEGSWVCPACIRDPLRLTRRKERLKDLLTNKPCDIMYRCNAPAGWPEDDLLYGYCQWSGNELISSDGDNYDIEDKIKAWEWDGEQLIVWIEVEWP